MKKNVSVVSFIDECCVCECCSTRDFSNRKTHFAEFVVKKTNYADVIARIRRQQKNAARNVTPDGLQTQFSSENEFVLESLQDNKAELIPLSGDCLQTEYTSERKPPPSISLRETRTGRSGPPICLCAPSSKGDSFHNFQ